MPHSTEKQSNRRQNRDLRCKRFGGGYADLGTGMHIDAAIALSRDRAGDVVANPEGTIAFAPAFAECAEGVRGFAALANGEHDRVARHRGIPVAKFTREL